MTPDEKLDHTPLGKGKHALKTPSALAEADPSYLIWAYETWNPKPCSALLYKDCKAENSRNSYQDRVGREQAD